MTTSWGDLIRSLGEAFGKLLSSEVSELMADLERSRRRFVAALILACAAMFMLFWAVGATAVVAFEALSTLMERWLAALFVLVLLLAIGAALAALAVRRFRSIERPMATAQRRLTDHLEWWQQSILQQQDMDKGLSMKSSQDEDSESPPLQ